MTRTVLESRSYLSDGGTMFKVGSRVVGRAGLYGSGSGLKLTKF